MQAGNISVRPGKQDLFEKEIRYNWVSFTALDIRVSFFSFFFFRSFVFTRNVCLVLFIRTLQLSLNCKQNSLNR